MRNSTRTNRRLKQWRHNRKFARTIDANFRDWQINVIFYAALHAVDAAPSELNVAVTDHEVRNRTVKENSAFSSVRNAYLNLYRISRVTRYDAEPDDWIPSQYLNVPDLADKLLRPIENGLTTIVPEVKYDTLQIDT
jgi:hypothetical protein